jgi:hypothetical protein
MVTVRKKSMLGTCLAASTLMFEAAVFLQALMMQQTTQTKPHQESRFLLDYRLPGG